MAENDIVEEIRARSGAIEEHLDALATARELPALALAVCTVRIDESGPPIRALLERAAAGERLDDSESSLLFCGLHILGAARDTQAWAPLLRLLRRPDAELAPLLGDAITMTLPQIVAGVFDGDAEALFEIIADTSVDAFVRDAFWGAAAFLAWDGRIERGAMEAFLERFFHEQDPDDDLIVWYGWQQAIALLGLRRLRPLVDRAWEEERLSEEISEPKHFEKDLAEAERAPDDVARFRAEQLGYIDDVVDALSWCVWDDEPEAWDGAEAREADAYERSSFYGDDDLPFDDGWIEPAVNPWRHVGRNDPCPCGSGRKFKKCCIGAGVVEQG